MFLASFQDIFFFLLLVWVFHLVGCCGDDYNVAKNKEMQMEATIEWNAYTGNDLAQGIQMNSLEIVP